MKSVHRSQYSHDRPRYEKTRQKNTGLRIRKCGVGVKFITKVRFKDLVKKLFKLVDVTSVKTIVANKKQTHRQGIVNFYPVTTTVATKIQT